MICLICPCLPGQVAEAAERPAAAPMRAASRGRVTQPTRPGSTGRSVRKRTMDDGAIDWRAGARAEAYAVALDQIDPVDSELFRQGTFEFYFERLRAEDPVHYSATNADGPYWSVTKYNDIVFVDTNHDLFSSEPAITYRDQADDFPLPMFIAMDPPRH